MQHTTILMVLKFVVLQTFQNLRYKRFRLLQVVSLQITEMLQVVLYPLPLEVLLGLTLVVLRRFLQVFYVNGADPDGYDGKVYGLDQFGYNLF